MEIELFARKHTSANRCAESAVTVLTNWEESQRNASNIVTGKTHRFDHLYTEMKFIYRGLLPIYAQMKDTDDDYYTVKDLMERLVCEINAESLRFYKSQRDEIERKYRRELGEIEFQISKLEKFDCLAEMEILDRVSDATK